MTPAETELLNVYVRMMADNYKSYELNLSSSVNEDDAFGNQLERIMFRFEECFSAQFPRFGFQRLQEFRWLYEDLPNNLMIEAFDSTNGEWNRLAFRKVIAESARIKEILNAATKSTLACKLILPFCGKAFEIVGLIEGLSELRHDIRFDIYLLDSDDVSLRCAEKRLTYNGGKLEGGYYDIRNCRVKLSNHDLEWAPMASADLVLGVHPEVFQPCYGRHSGRWQRILRNCVENSQLSIMFTLSPAERDSIKSQFCQTHMTEEIRTGQGVGMPREYIAKAARQRKGINKSLEHRYYGFAIAIRRVNLGLDIEALSVASLS